MNRPGATAFPPDAGLRDVLEQLGVSPAAYLGHGGEAWVYVLDADRVVRVLQDGGTAAGIAARQALVTELRAGDPPFALPDVLEVGEHAGRWYAIERRLPGTPVLDLLATADGAARDELVEHHLDAVAQLAALPLAPRAWFGDLLADPPLRTATWTSYLRARAADSLARATPELAGIDAHALADALPDVASGCFVHLDAFTGNMLADGTTITAVLDIGTTSVVGDARLDPVAAAVYLGAPEITPTATARDADVAESWLRAAGLADWVVPAQRWLAAFWSFAVDDLALHAWCRRVLLAA